MHVSTFEYLNPTDQQMASMALMRSAFAELARLAEFNVPPGLDRDYMFRHLREASMWANVAIVRLDDGTPRA